MATHKLLMGTLWVAGPPPFLVLDGGPCRSPHCLPTHAGHVLLTLRLSLPPPSLPCHRSAWNSFPPFSTWGLLLFLQAPAGRCPPLPGSLPGCPKSTPGRVARACPLPSTWIFAHVFDLALEPPAGVISLQVSFPAAQGPPGQAQGSTGRLLNEGESEWVMASRLWRGLGTCGKDRASAT